MIWQDWVVAVGSGVITLSLLPTVFGPDKPALSTCLITGSILLIFAATFATLQMWLTAGINCLTATLWLVLAGQVLYRHHKATG